MVDIPNIPSGLHKDSPENLQFLQAMKDSIEGGGSSGGIDIGGAIRRISVSSNDVAGNFNIDATISGDFVRAQGQTLNRTDYPDLFTAFGLPDAATTLVLPNDSTIYVRVA